MAENKPIEQPAAREHRLEGQVALITGSESGIGRAIALAFAKEGADIVVTYHSDEPGAHSAAREVEAAGRRALVRQLDVREESSVAEVFEAAVRELGVPNILVNNAGVSPKSTSLAETETDNFDTVIKTNLYGPFLCCREFIRRRQGMTGGKIINITSVHEAIPSPGHIAYGAAKGGMLTLTRSLALELAEMRVNVNAIAPGQIRTPMTEDRINDPETRAKEMQNIPLHRPGEPWEVARLALYLATAEADYVTGQSFTIDGGLKMNWGQGA